MKSNFNFYRRLCISLYSLEPQVLFPLLVWDTMIKKFRYEPKKELSIRRLISYDNRFYIINKGDDITVGFKLIPISFGANR